MIYTKINKIIDVEHGGLDNSGIFDDSLKHIEGQYVTIDIASNHLVVLDYSNWNSYPWKIIMVARCFISNYILDCKYFIRQVLSSYCIGINCHSTYITHM